MEGLDYGRLGARVRQARKAKGWSQEELARRCGISMSFLGHIERGTRIMGLGTFVNICSALDASADGLLWGVAQAPDAMRGMWDGRAPSGAGAGKGPADSYAMYVRIMKSVAEIMSGA